MIRLQHIGYCIGGRNILADVSLHVAPGTFCAIAGPNGAGKSTLLSVATGSLRQTSGSADLGGRPIRQWKPKDLARRSGVLHQKTALNLPFQVREVVAMGRYPHEAKNSAEQDAIIIGNALHYCGIAHLADADYTRLSGGEQQRVQLARVFAQIWNPGDRQTRYLFLDEPGNNLDIRFQHECLQLARDFAAAGNCVVAILHDLNLILQYADTALLMKSGRVISGGPVGEALTEASLSAAFDYPLRFIGKEDGFPVIVPDTGVFFSKTQTAFS